MAGNGKELSKDEPIGISVENLRLNRSGVYQIDLHSLMDGKPLVVKIKEGIYRVDLTSSPTLI